MDAVLNTVTTLTIIMGSAVVLGLTIWVVGTFGLDAWQEHTTRRDHRHYTAAQAARRLDAQERTAGYVRKHTQDVAL